MTTEILEPARTVSELEGDTVQVLESNIRQFVTFITGSEVFAVDMAPVQEIIRVPEVVRVPLAPPTLDGLANLRGRVLPIISLRRIFGFPGNEYDDSTRAVVIDIGQPLGFVVDRVTSVVGVEPGRIEGVDSLRGTVNTELLSGLLKDVGGHAMVMLLDFAKLIAAEFADIARLAGEATGPQRLGEGSLDADDAKVSDELQLVSFVVAGQEYAITIDDVQEIVQVPEDIVHVPNSESHVLGVMTLRNRLLPLVSLRRMFGLPPQAADDHSRIVVVALGNTSVGVVMDSVNEVLRVAKSQVDTMPSLFARDGDLSEITEICRLDGGQRLVSVISAGTMFHHSAIKEALSSMDPQTDEAAAGGEPSNEDDEQMVVFRLGREEFGVPIDSVQEIVRVPDELTHVPKAPSFVEGVINLRGSVLPVVDQRRRLGLATLERNEQQRIMVFTFNGVRTGFIVDSVTEVLKVARASIEVAPHLSGEQARLIGRVANLERQKRLIQLIEPSHLVEGEDLQGLASLAE
ncbi:chemotaxis protein CheW [Paludibacterium yongneupense]|uniref:chemotaxis protein CheW n=1 Tax=Paludibacterium yongneupense TaxID=400061 RepID=UPI00042836A2|nr:chemotaxis protein CheW [Paludibacterium yongneupense]